MRPSTIFLLQSTAASAFSPSCFVRKFCARNPSRVHEFPVKLNYRNDRGRFKAPKCAMDPGEMTIPLDQQLISTVAFDNAILASEELLHNAGAELAKSYPSLSFPASLLESASEELKGFMTLSIEDRIKNLGIVSLVWLYFTARPGVLAGAVDAFLLAPVQSLKQFIKGRTAFKRTDFVIGRRLGEGSFGTVYEGGLLRDGSGTEEELGRRSRSLEDVDDKAKVTKVVMKKVKLDVFGAEQCGEVEEWFNLRMQRVAPGACAKYLGSFVADKSRGQYTAGGKWLVWKFEGDSTLLDFMSDRSFPDNIGEAIYGENYMKGADPFKRRSVTIRRIMRKILVSLKKMHNTGIVHRDIKPSNLIITNRGAVKLIDFGAATDLRVGKNYIPDMGMLDPDYCPPEQYVLPDTTPKPPPAPVAAFISPLLWQFKHPDLFDMYSLGIIFLQMSCPQLRTASGLQIFKAELRDAEFDLKEWRRMTRMRPDLRLLEIDGGRGWDLATKLVSNRGNFFKGRLSAAEALNHPYFLLSGDQVLSMFQRA